MNVAMLGSLAAGWAGGAGGRGKGCWNKRAPVMSQIHESRNSSSCMLVIECSDYQKKLLCRKCLPLQNQTSRWERPQQETAAFHYAFWYYPIFNYIHTLLRDTKYSQKTEREPNLTRQQKYLRAHGEPWAGDGLQSERLKLPLGKQTFLTLIGGELDWIFLWVCKQRTPCAQYSPQGTTQNSSVPGTGAFVAFSLCSFTVQSHLQDVKSKDIIC